MKKTNLFLTMSIAALLSGCGGGSSTPEAETEVVSGLATPDNVEVIQDDSANSANLAAANYAAYDSAETDYTKKQADVWIDVGAWSEPLDMADMLMCIMKGTGADQVHSTTGETYNALIDMSQCDTQGGGTQESKKTRFAEVVAKSTRTSNTSPHVVDAYFTDRTDDNDDGDTLDSGEEMQYLAQASVTKAPSTTNPFGEFTFNWAQNTGSVALWDKGSLELGAVASGAADFKFINKMQGVNGVPANTEIASWASGNLNIDGSGGKIKVSHTADSTNTYKVRFNATHANVQTNASTPVCYNLDESTMTPFVYSYNLYDTDGALKDINAGLEFVYDDNGTKDGRGYAGQYKFHNGSVYVNKTWMWTSGNDEPTTIYEESDNSLSHTVSWSVTHEPTIANLTFDPRIEIQASYIDSTGATKTNDLNYEGPGQLWGIPWTDTNGALDGGYKPAFSLANSDLENGATLTDTAGVTWKVKRTGLWKEMATASESCTAIPVTDSDVDFTVPTLAEVSTTWAGKPTPAVTKAKMIHGVKQF